MRFSFMIEVIKNTSIQQHVQRSNLHKIERHTHPCRLSQQGNKCISSSFSILLLKGIVKTNREIYKICYFCCPVKV